MRWAGFFRSKLGCNSVETRKCPMIRFAIVHGYFKIVDLRSSYLCLSFLYEEKVSEFRIDQAGFSPGRVGRHRRAILIRPSCVSTRAIVVFQR